VPNVVSDTGPLIALAGVGQLNLLHQLFGQVFIPPAVHSEIQDETSLAAMAAADWISLHSVQDAFAVQLLREELDSGESEAITLARELAVDGLVIDERAARRKAQAVGLRVIGTLGVLLLAKSRGHLAELKPWLDQLRRENFRLSEALYAQALQDAGESA
jgi:uncharacterized protein